MKKTNTNEKKNQTSNMKERIINESIRLFLKKSYQGTSIQHITDALGITKGALYWHFKNKEDLLMTIIDKYNEGFLEKMYIHMKDSRSDFLKIFKEYHRYINEYAKDNSELSFLFVTLSAEMAGSNSAVEKKINDVYKKYFHFIESLLFLGKSEGYFNTDFDIMLNTHIVIAIHNGALLQWYMNKKDIDSVTFGRTYQDIILHGMVKKTKK